MLTAEEIKKACEFADGFEYGENNDRDKYLRFYYNKERELVWVDSTTFRYIYYPLFLQRVIEGINIEGKTWIAQSKSWIQTPTLPKKIFSHNQCVTEDFYIKDGNYDQAKEQAIKYILEKI